MALEKREVEFPKEVDDCLVLVVELFKDIRAKKKPSELMSENLQNLIATIDGIDRVDDEVKAHRKEVMQAVGYRMGELSDAIIG